MKYALTVFLLGFSLIARADDLPRAAVLAPVVEVEEDIYTYTNAQNGAGPMWCSGSTTLVRVGDRLFASGLETVPDAEPRLGAADAPAAVQVLQRVDREPDPRRPLRLVRRACSTASMSAPPARRSRAGERRSAPGRRTRCASRRPRRGARGGRASAAAAAWRAASAVPDRSPEMWTLTMSWPAAASGS